MKKMIIVLLLTSWIFTILSCRKECSYVELGDIECDKGFYLLEEEVLLYEGIHKNMEQGREYIITSKAQLDSLDINSAWEDNDFSQFDIIGVDKFTGIARSARRHHWVCMRNDGKVIKLIAEFSLKDQCQSSGIFTIPLSFWARIPKIPEGQTIEFQITNLNPY